MKFKKSPCIPLFQSGNGSNPLFGKEGLGSGDFQNIISIRRNSKWLSK
jgi:hypothetical protein